MGSNPPRGMDECPNKRPVCTWKSVDNLSYIIERPKILMHNPFNEAQPHGDVGGRAEWRNSIIQMHEWNTHIMLVTNTVWDRSRNPMRPSRYECMSQMLSLLYYESMSSSSPSALLPLGCTCDGTNLHFQQSWDGGVNMFNRVW